MDIRTKSGKCWYEIDPTLAALMVDCGLAEKIEKPAPKPKPAPAPWGIGRHPLSGRWFIKHVVGQSTSFYDGPPDAEKIRLAMPGIPDDVIGSYLQARQFKPSVPASIWGE
jgi:hypothetical protein